MMLQKCSMSVLLGIAMCAGLGGCGEAEPPAAGAGEHDAVDQIKGRSILSVRLTERSHLQIVETDDDVAIMLKGHLDDAAALRPVIDRVNQSRSFAEIYTSLTGHADVPEGVAALDRKRVDASGIAPVLVAPPDDASDDGEPSTSVAETPGSPAKSATGSIMSEPPWDWVADCTWFLNLSPNTCDSRWNATSVTWAWIQRSSKEHWGQLMAASHVNGSDMKVEQWNGSSWTTLFSMYTPLRYYWTLWYGSSSGSTKTRKFSNYGRGGAEARTHTHVGWNIDRGSGDIGKICFHSYLCQTP